MNIQISLNSSVLLGDSYGSLPRAEVDIRPLPRRDSERSFHLVEISNQKCNEPINLKFTLPDPISVSLLIGYFNARSGTFSRQEQSQMLDGV